MEKSKVALNPSVRAKMKGNPGLPPNSLKAKHGGALLEARTPLHPPNFPVGYTRDHRVVDRLLPTMRVCREATQRVDLGSVSGPEIQLPREKN